MIEKLKTTLLRLERYCPFALLLGITTYLCWPVLINAGWPINHERLSFFERTEVFRRSFLVFNFYPTWWPSLSHGYGSPLPLFYHRLFYTFSGAIAVPLHSSIRGVTVAVFVIFFLGSLGMLRLLMVAQRTYLPWSAQSANSRLALVGTCLFMFSPYVWMDWAVRGAMAEFTASMIVPWYLAELIQINNSRVIHWHRLAILAILLFHAHIVMALYFFLVVTVFLIWQYLKNRSVFKFGYNFLVSYLLIFIFALVPGIVSNHYRGFFNTNELGEKPWRPQDNFVFLQRYFYDNSFDWGHQWSGFSVEINRFVILALLLFLTVAVLRKISLRRGDLIFFTGVFLALMAFQTKVSLPVYQDLPFANYLQFPWRLVGFLSPLAILLLILVAAEFVRRGSAFLTELSLLSVLFFTVGYFCSGRQFLYQWYSPKEINTSLDNLELTVIGREYLPKDVQESDLKHIPLITVDSECGAQIIDKYVAPTGVVRVNFYSPQTCEARIRQFQSPLLATHLKNAQLMSPSLLYHLRLNPGRSFFEVQPKNIFQLFLEAI